MKSTFSVSEPISLQKSISKKKTKMVIKIHTRNSNIVNQKLFLKTSWTFSTAKVAYYDLYYKAVVAIDSG